MQKGRSAWHNSVLVYNTTIISYKLSFENLSINPLNDPLTFSWLDLILQSRYKLYPMILQKISILTDLNWKIQWGLKYYDVWEIISSTALIILSLKNLRIYEWGIPFFTCVWGKNHNIVDVYCSFLTLITILLH